MKILIIGGGSIGQRHLRNLKELDIKKIGLFDVSEQKREEVKNKYGVEVFKDLNTILKEKWDVIFICTPPSKHIEIALKVVEKKIPIFIEKPLSNSLKNIQTLISKTKKYKLPVTIGTNLRFHPQLLKIKAILNKNILGKIWGIRAEFGQYLPDWHPRENYQYSYSAQKKLGGGILLDDIHEIDYLFWLFGDIKKVFGCTGKISNLRIDTEDYAEIILWFKNDIIGEIHMDYLQRDYSRSLKIIGEKGTLRWNLKKHELKYYLVKDKKWHINKLQNFDFNQTYLNEIKYFLNCIKNQIKPESDIFNGYETLKIALAVKKSAKLEKPIKII